jgi:hypothetical protein
MLRTVVVLLIALLMRVDVAHAQIRGLYAPGTFATNSGVLPDPGLTYIDLFQLYSFGTLKGPEGHDLPVSLAASVVADQNAFMWVTKHKAAGGTIAFMADLPIVTNSLTLVRFGAISGAAGMGDSFFSPFTLGWKLKRADLQAAYGFTTTTGRFHAGANDNIGAGYWAHMPFAGQTVYLTKDKMTNVSAFEAYEFHTTQQETEIHPGQTFDIDYSLTHTFKLDKDMHKLLQVGLVGYGQYQTTDKTGPGVNPVVEANTHYRVNSLGATGWIILPARKFSLGVKYFKEFANRSTVQGYSFQIMAALTF